MKLYISPTNQYPNTYAYGNTNEGEQCNRIAIAVGKELAKYEVDYQVGDSKKMMWITDANGKLVGGRIKDAVDWKADWYIEIHTNATGLVNSTGVGAMTLIRMLPDRQTLGKIMVDALNAICPYKANRGGVVDGYTRQYGAVCYPENHGVKALMIEVNYHDYAPVAKWIIENTTKIGQTIAMNLAKHFGLKKKSTATTTTTKKPTTTTTTTAKPNSTLYRVQVGAFNNKNYAANYVVTLKKAGYEAFVVEAVKDGKKLYRVQVGAFRVKTNADNYVKQLKKDGFDAFIVTVRTAETPTIKVGSKIKIRRGAKTYTGGTLSSANWLYTTILDVMEISGDRVVVGLKGQVTAAVNKKDLILQ